MLHTSFNNLKGSYIMWGAALGAGINGIMSMITSAQNNSYAKEAASRQYHYSIRSLKESPKAQRQGLEDAGYNPMLALGNIGAGVYSGSGQSAQMQVPDIVGGAKAASKIVQDVMKGYKLQNEKTEKEIENLESDLETKETQRLQAEANTSLLHSQEERSELAYGRDIVDTVTGIAGTGASLYSAKAMADVAKQNADTNARNASVREAKANMKNKGVPSVDTSAKGSKPNAAGALGSSSKSVGSIAKQVAKEIAFGALPIGIIGGASAAVDHALGDDSFYKRVHKKSRKLHEKSWSNTPRRVILH